MRPTQPRDAAEWHKSATPIAARTARVPSPRKSSSLVSYLVARPQRLPCSSRLFPVCATQTVAPFLWQLDCFLQAGFPPATPRPPHPSGVPSDLPSPHTLRLFFATSAI